MAKYKRTYFLLVCFWAVLHFIAGLQAVGGISKSNLQHLFSHPHYIGLHTGAKEFYLSEDEKYTVALINLARFTPRIFIKEIIIPSGADTSAPEMSNLLAHLRKHKSTFPLMPAFSLYKSAMVHAKDMGTSGKGGHVGSDGKDYQDRIQQYFSSPTKFSENYYQGSGDPVDVVLQMMLGKGESGAKYLENILSVDIHYIGLSILPHRLKCSNAVIDFAKKPQVPTSTGRKKDNMEVYWRDCPTGTKVTTRRKSGGFSFSGLFGGKK